MTQRIKVVVEQHPDTFVAYPIEVEGVVVAQGNSYEEALKEPRSSIAFHVETFSGSVLDDDAESIEKFLLFLRSNRKGIFQGRMRMPSELDEFRRTS